MNGILIRQKRRDMNLTQQQLADMAQIAQSVIAELENGTRQSASMPTLKRISSVLNVSLDELTTDITTQAATTAA